MPETLEAKVTQKKALAFTLCLAFITVLAVFIFSNENRSPVIENPANEINPQNGNDVTAISELNAEVASLKKEILQLDETIAQQESENKNLREHVISLEKGLDQILNELDSLEKIEHIRLTVDRLRNQPEELSVYP